MFVWDKTVHALDVPAKQVVHLFRSMREVQLALPGISAQEASAYLCQYRKDGGIETIAVFHLRKAGELAFYFSDPRVVDEAKMDSMLDRGLNFVESMGFLLTDQDIHLLDDDDRRMLWESLPLKEGLPKGGDVKAPPETARKLPEEDIEELAAEVAETGTPSDADDQAATRATEHGRSAKPSVPVASEATKATAVTAETPEDNVDDLLAAVEAMRAKRPGIRARKVAPTPEDMGRRKENLRQLVGRILASL